MVQYSILGGTISFDDAALRFFDIQYHLWQMEDAASRSFDDWYQSSKDIDSVLNAFEVFASDTVRKLAIEPLFSTLSKAEIYDISRAQYENQCLNFDKCAEALAIVQEKYDSIVSRQEDAAEYRAARKNARSRWVGGGFGVEGALKGAATASAYNAVTGLGHSMFNAVGNAGSAIAASASKSELYSNPSTKQILKSGINEALEFTVNAHIQLLNNRIHNYIRSVFDSNKASALFENAKELQDKQSSLLLQAITYCPWYADLIRFVFLNDINDRVEVWSLAQRFHVDLSNDLEALLSQQYSPDAKQSEEAARKARARILSIMKEFDVHESSTLNELEQDCIARLCQGWEDADEATCNAIRQKVNTYDARESNKAPFLENLQKRIEEIWTSEDKASFEKIYLETDITSPQAVANAITYIKSNSRTSACEKYLEALDACNEENIVRAQIYHQGKKPKLFKTLGVLFLILAVLGLLAYGILAAIILGIIAIVFFCKASSLKSNWNTLTIDNTVVPPVLTNAPTKKR